MPDAPLTNRIELTGDPSSGALHIDGHLLPFAAAVLRLEAPNTPVHGDDDGDRRQRRR